LLFVLGVVMDSDIPGVRTLISKLDGIHPSHHSRRRAILRQIVIVIDNWIRKNGTGERSIIVLAKVLDNISRNHYYAYAEMLKMTRYPKVYQQAINHLRWARLHKKMGGVLSFDV